MNKYKILVFIVAIVILMNIVLIGFLFTNNERGPRHRVEPKEIIIEKLHFNASQIAVYEKTIRQHQQKIHDLDDAIREQKNLLYSMLPEKNADTKKVDSIINHIAQLQKEIEHTHYNHFLEIKKICTPEQLQDYDALTEELSQLFSHPKRPMHER